MDHIQLEQSLCTSTQFLVLIIRIIKLSTTIKVKTVSGVKKSLDMFYVMIKIIKATEPYPINEKFLFYYQNVQPVWSDPDKYQSVYVYFKNRNNMTWREKANGEIENYNG